MRVGCWIKLEFFYLLLRTTEFSFSFRAMSSLIGFPPVSSLNFSNDPHCNLKNRNQLLFSLGLSKCQFFWHKLNYPCLSIVVTSLDSVSFFLIMKLKQETLGQLQDGRTNYYRFFPRFFVTEKSIMAYWSSIIWKLFIMLRYVFFCY